MYDTLDHVHPRRAFTWFGDWVLDDQPIWVKTAKRADPRGAVLGRNQRHHHDGVAPPRVRRAARPHPRMRSTGSIWRAKESTRISRHRRTPVCHRPGASHQIFSSSSTLTSTSNPGRGALDRAADLRLVRHAGAEAEGMMSMNTQTTLAAHPRPLALARCSPRTTRPCAVGLSEQHGPHRRRLRGGLRQRRHLASDRRPAGQGSGISRSSR